MPRKRKGMFVLENCSEFKLRILSTCASLNGGIFRVEPTNQDVQEVCLVLQVRLSQTGLKSFGNISEPKIKGKALKLALFKNRTSYAAHQPNSSKTQILPPFKSNFHPLNLPKKASL